MKLRTFATMLAVALLSLLFTSTQTTSAQQVPDVTWQAQFYDNAVLGEPAAFTRTVDDIRFNWGFGAPDQSIDANRFSARFATDVTLSGGTYRFWVLADDNVSVTIDFRNTIIDTFETEQVDELVAADITLDAGQHHIQVDYREVVDEAFIYVDWENLASNPRGPDFPVPVDGRQPGSATWNAQFFANTGLSGAPVYTTTVNDPNAQWGTAPPYPPVPADYWSARFSTTLNLDQGDYVFRVTADDGVRVFVDGILVINEWHLATAQAYTATRSLIAGNHTITIEYYENTGRANLQFDINATNVTQPPVGPGEPMATVITAVVNVRDYPGVARGEIIARVRLGESYRALALGPDGIWVQIDVNGQEGWISRAFVNVTNANALPVIENPATEPVPTGYTVSATPYTVNIRTGPSTQFDILGTLPAGTSAEVIGRNANATWWQIDYQGIVGWVSGTYAIIESGAQLGQIPVTG